MDSADTGRPSLDAFARYRLVVLAVALLLVLGGLATVTAASADAETYKWSRSTVRYYVHSKDPIVINSVAVAARAWNDLGLKIKLVRTKSSRKAKLDVRLFRLSHFPPGTVGTGELPLGNRRGELALSRTLFDSGGGLPHQRDTIAVIVHEFGHTLGLNHVNSCSVMRPVVGDPCGTGLGDGDQVLCTPTSGDFKRLRKLYGAKRGRKPRLRTCTALLRATNSLPGTPVTAPVEWSLDGVNWSPTGGPIATGSTVWIRHAASTSPIPFPFASLLTLEFRYNQESPLYSSWGPGGATVQAACIALTNTTSKPDPGVPCTPEKDPSVVEGLIEGVVRMRDSSKRYWMISKLVADKEATTLTIDASVVLPFTQVKVPAGTIVLTTPPS
ncbi:MAG: matrixin family metalloprotease [Solirubrobacterales bacterium]